MDQKLNFDEHAKDLCGKANSKLRALARVTTHINLAKNKNKNTDEFLPCLSAERFIDRTIVELNIWMKDVFIFLLRKYSTYEKLHENDESVSILHKNIQAIAIKVLKNIIGLSLQVFEKSLKLITICGTCMTIKIMPNIFCNFVFKSKESTFEIRKKVFISLQKKLISFLRYSNFRVLVS